MHTRFILSALLVIITLDLYGHSWTPAYLITEKQDTITGFLKYQEWKYNPGRIYFKMHLTDTEAKEYTPLQIREIHVQDRIYKGGVVDVEKSSFQTNNLQPGADFILEKDTAFLLTLISGPKSLYILVDGEGKEHFYIASEDTLTLLLYKRYLSAARRVLDVNRYKWQLTEYLSNCSSVVSYIRDYSRANLVRLFRKYYACTGAPITTHPPTRRISAQAGVVAGVTQTKIDFDTEYIGYLNNAEYKASTNPTAGIYLDLFLSGYQKKWSFYHSIAYTSFNTHGNYLDIKGPEWEITTDATLEYAYLKSLHILQYRHPFAKNRLICGIGASFGVMLDETNFSSEHTRYLSTERTITGRALEEVKKQEQGFVCKLGVQRDRISFQIMYEFSSGMSTYETLSSNIRRYYALIGYAF